MMAISTQDKDRPWRLLAERVDGLSVEQHGLGLMALVWGPYKRVALPLLSKKAQILHTFYTLACYIYNQRIIMRRGGRPHYE